LKDINEIFLPLVNFMPVGYVLADLWGKDPILGELREMRREDILQK
jgi:hypothetical protein